MAIALDGLDPGSPANATWASVTDCVRWEVYDIDGVFVKRAEATTTEGSFILNDGKRSGSPVVFDFLLSSGWKITLNPIAINRDYYPAFIGKNLTPSGQTWGTTTGVLSKTVPCPPQSMTYELVHDKVQEVDDPPPDPNPLITVYYYRGVEAIEGFTDQTA
jgi:hypothetical protein